METLLITGRLIESIYAHNGKFGPEVEDLNVYLMRHRM